ncbi:hypothetical protein [Mesorhizobium sp. M0968]|uniref:hypothetical protein n=1 Tax=Mesorhizobium sp. M0968 TaxID=2957037 RepID=UPI00333ACBC6
MRHFTAWPLDGVADAAATLLRMINRLVEPTSGIVKIDGADNRSLPGYAAVLPEPEVPTTAAIVRG